MRIFIFLVAASFSAVTSLCPPGAKAQAAEAGKFDARAIVEEVRDVISGRYVLPERRAVLDAALAQGLASGRYAVKDPVVFAERVNEDLEKAGRDKHLGFALDPQQAAMLKERKKEAPDMSAFERRARAANHGITELRLLPGNIRYMALDGSIWIGKESAAVFENAMRFLSGGEAIIIDVRRNPGGDSEPSQYLLSHFLPAGTPLFTYYREGGGNPTRVVTHSEVPAGRVIGKPLYVLTSASTASAPEELAGNVAGYRLGEVVGEKTAGAGFAVSRVPIKDRFVLSLSTGRVVLASTGRDWEATGISPTIRTAAPQALDVAHAHALGRLSREAPAQERPRLRALAEGFAARVESRVPALPLAAYAGNFGERRIILEEGQLFFQRGAGERIRLVPLGGNRFSFDNNPGQHLEFIATGGSVNAFTLILPNASAQGTYERSR